MNTLDSGPMASHEIEDIDILRLPRITPVNPFVRSRSMDMLYNHMHRNNKQYISYLADHTYHIPSRPSQKPFLLVEQTIEDHYQHKIYKFSHVEDGEVAYAFYQCTNFKNDVIKVPIVVHPTCQRRAPPSHVRSMSPSIALHHQPLPVHPPQVVMNQQPQPQQFYSNNHLPTQSEHIPQQLPQPQQQQQQQQQFPPHPLQQLDRGAPPTEFISQHDITMVFGNAHALKNVHYPCIMLINARLLTLAKIILDHLVHPNMVDIVDVSADFTTRINDGRIPCLLAYHWVKDQNSSSWLFDGIDSSTKQRAKYRNLFEDLADKFIDIKYTNEIVPRHPLPHPTPNVASSPYASAGSINQSVNLSTSSHSSLNSANAILVSTRQRPRVIEPVNAMLSQSHQPPLHDPTSLPDNIMSRPTFLNAATFETLRRNHSKRYPSFDQYIQHTGLANETTQFLIVYRKFIIKDGIVFNQFAFSDDYRRVWYKNAQEDKISLDVGNAADYPGHIRAIS